MAINKAMYTGVTQIMDAFDRNAQVPYYSVWAGKDMIFSYNEDDMDQGRVYLMENLIASEQNEHSDILKIKFHPKKEKTFITDKSPAIATLFVRVCDPNYMRGQVIQQSGGMNYGMQSLIERQMEMLNGISSRLTALEEVQEDEEEEDEDSTDALLGRIGNILNHPTVSAIVATILPNILPMIKPQPQPQPMVSGIDDQLEVLDENELVGASDFEQEAQYVDLQSDTIEKINLALGRLMAHTNDLGGDLTALADMADNNPAQFKMLLSMLKK
jgi:hypothetical protein